MTARQPADVDQLFAEALSRGDLEGALSMYEPDGTWRFVIDLPSGASPRPDGS